MMWNPVGVLGQRRGDRPVVPGLAPRLMMWDPVGVVVLGGCPRYLGWNPDITILSGHPTWFYIIRRESAVVGVKFRVLLVVRFLTI